MNFATRPGVHQAHPGSSAYHGQGHQLQHGYQIINTQSVSRQSSLVPPPVVRQVSLQTRELVQPRIGITLDLNHLRRKDHPLRSDSPTTATVVLKPSYTYNHGGSAASAGAAGATAGAGAAAGGGGHGGPYPNNGGAAVSSIICGSLHQSGPERRHFSMDECRTPSTLF